MADAGQADLEEPPVDTQTRVFRQLMNNPWITGSMVILFIWGACNVGGHSTRLEMVPPLLLMLCAAMCGLILVLSPSGPGQTGSLSAVVLVSFTIIGIIGSNSALSDLVPMFGPEFVRSNRERWEIVALISTAFMALIYLDSLDIIKDGFQNRRGADGLGTINILLFFSLICIGFALANLHHQVEHYIYVILVTISFALVDLYIWISLRKSTEKHIREIAGESKSLLFLLDIPVLLGLSVLFIFFLQLGCDPSQMGSVIADKMIVSELLDQACVEAYPFLAGALAFQMISFNVIYVFFSFGVHKQMERVEKIVDKII